MQNKTPLIFLFLILLMLPLYLVTREPAGPEDFPSLFTRDVTNPENFGDELPQAPDFELVDMEGNIFRLSDNRGKVVVLNLWATWCPPCREEIPDFMELQEEMQGDVLFVGVSIDREGWDVVRPFVEEMQINYPQVVDDGRFTRLYGPIRGVPTTFLVNREGYIEGFAPGMLHKEQLRPMLEAIAAK
ncbi:MAG: TlpA family protein disulfide reductase [Balneolales bacterium]|nr:TlpA family protein disulfide reductase [Balneolales bacterium]